jgi:hypothetical protein
MYKTLFAFALLSFAGCSFDPVHTEAQKATLNDAQDKYFECGIKYVPSTDDMTSDAQTIALALSMRCGAEYEESINAACVALVDNNNQCKMLRDGMHNRERRIESFLQIVLKYRSIKK